MPSPHVFLSAASADFKQLRNELADSLRRAGCTVKHQNDFVPTGGQTLEKLAEYLRGCTVVVHVIGPQFGAMAEQPSVDGLRHEYGPAFLAAARWSRLHAALNDPGVGWYALSYTQWEAYLALHHERRLLAYQKDADGWDKRQTDHVARLRAVDIYADSFADEAKLKQSSLESIVQILSSEYPDQGRKLERQLRRIIHLPYPTLGRLFKGRKPS